MQQKANAMKFTFRRFVAATMAIAAVLTPVSINAQFSDSYSFLKAVRDRDGAKVTEIISKPGSVIIDTKERTTGEAALHIVTRARDTQWLGFLLARGAKADVRDGQGVTPLLIAAQLGFVDGAQMLLSRRASVDLANNGGETPLIIAVQRRDPAMVRLLLMAGANPNKADSVAGQSARDYATSDRRATAILKLIDEAKPANAAKPVGPS